MAIIKCKMCGGELEITQGATVAECEYCGTKQTLPRLDDDRKANLYDRANHFRRNNEFDKAMGIYEQILNEDGTDAEAYWSLVLCRYGIEYVEDSASHKRLPTINRAQFTSIFDDDNYKSALQYADKYQKDIYEAEAKAINEIQKKILAISEKEEPFDVFVCYKETDNSGRRTPDSVLAQELYYQLTQEGFKVFFSRITLEDKLGSAYEPYIFAALNSAKVMVVLGTKPEHFKAVWVRNEWSRYLSLIKSGAKKTLIPAYKDMDPYDLPEEFSHLQAQDMSKLGFMQDLLRGIKKIVGAEDKKTTVIKETVVSSGNTNTASLLKRAFLFLEDGDWNSADEYCEKVLDVDPECAEAYLGKLMVELRVKRQDDLKDQAEPFDDNSNYQKAMRFADGTLKTALVGYIKRIRECKEATHLDGIYSEAQKTMSDAKTEKECIKAAHLFESIGDYKDSALLAQECVNQAEICKEVAIKDAQKRKRVGIILAICAAAFALIAAFIYIFDTVIIPYHQYNEGLKLLAAGEFDQAYAAFEALGDYSDSADQCKEVRYQQALSYWDKKEYEDSNPIFEKLESYKDSAQRIHFHRYISEIIIAPGCETKGEKKIACETCPHFYTSPVNATGHVYGEMQITKAATCTATGEKEAVCGICGKTTTETIAMIEHAYSGTITKSATCEEDGLKTFSCGCGTSYTEVIKATGHSYKGVVTTAATCYKDGVKTYSCHCGKSYTETIKSAGHNYSEATCTTASVCANCGHTRQAALGHENLHNRCTRCDKNLTQTVEATFGVGSYNTLLFSDKYAPALGQYYCTVTVLEVGTPLEGRPEPYIALMKTMSSGGGEGLFMKQYPDIYAGAKFTFYFDVSEYWDYSITAFLCKVNLKIEPAN